MNKSKIILFCSVFLLAFTFTTPTAISSSISNTDYNSIMQKAEQRRIAIAQTMEASTVLIIAENRDSVGMGTGFVVKEGYVLTNAHVIDGKNTFYILGKGFSPIKASLVKKLHNEAHDFALLKFSPTKSMPVLSFNRSLRRTDKVSAWGYPYLVTQFDKNTQKAIDGHFENLPPIVYTEGIVSAFVQNDAQSIIHSAAVAAGNSGGPLVNSRGEVVGVNTWGATDDNEGAFVNGALTAQAAINFLHSCNIQALIVDSGNDPIPFEDTPTYLANNSNNSNSANSSLATFGSIANAIVLGENTGQTSRQNPPSKQNPPSSTSAENTFASIIGAGLEVTEFFLSDNSKQGREGRRPHIPHRPRGKSDELNSELAKQLTGKAKELYLDAVNGDAYAQAYIGVSYYLGEEAPEVEKEGIYWLEKAAFQNNAGALSTLGSIYITDPNYLDTELGLDLLYKGAEIDDEFASVLADFLIFGEVYGIEQDFASAYHAAKRGEKVNDSDALAILSYLYAIGDANLCDHKEAFRLAKIAEKDGNPLAYAVLSWLYRNSDVIEKDLEKAVEYAQKSSDEENTFGTGLLALFFASGEGVELNYEKAYELAENSALQAGELGQYVLGALYAYGHKVNQDLPLAWAYLTMAAEKRLSAAEELRDSISAEMTNEQIEEAKQYVHLWRRQWGLSG